MRKGKKHSETHLRCQSCIGSQKESPSQTKSAEAKSSSSRSRCNLLEAIRIVFDDLTIQGVKTSGDDILLSSRRFKKLYRLVVNKWEQLSNIDHCEDAFPYRKSYVKKQWMTFRKRQRKPDKSGKD